MGSVTKEAILATKPPREAVEWQNGEVVYVAAMSGTARDAFEMENTELAKAGNDARGKNLRARMLVKCLTDDDGNRLFRDEDAAELGKVWGAMLDKAFVVAIKLNVYSPKDLEELEKNS